MTAYIRNIRIIATYAVILLHVAAQYAGLYNIIPLGDWKVSNLLDSICRFCIPVFLMISGALFLDKDEDLGPFLLKRLKRILLPFIFWATCYFLIGNYEKISQANVLLVLKNYWLYIYQNASTTHFWYIYLIIGLYLFIPILRKWCVNASKKDLIYFLVIWGITLFMTKHTMKYFPPITLQYFSQYIGFLILGHYLNKHTNYKGSMATILFASFFILSVFVTYYLTEYFSIDRNEFVGIFYSNLSPNVVVTSISLYLLIKSIKTSNNNSNLVKQLDFCSYGIYLIHIIIMVKILPYIKIYTKDNPFSLFLHIMIASITIYFTCFIIIYTLSRIKRIRGFIT